MAFIPFVKTSSAGSPCIDVEIEGQRLSLELDLGLQGDLSLHTNVLDKVQGKSLEETKMFIGFRGDPYSKNLYRLPCLKIENFSFENRILQEHDDAFEEQSLFFPEESHTQEPGRIGWKLFAGYLLLLDLPANHMILAKSYTGLHRFLNGDFIELPLTLEEGLIGLHLKDEKGEIIHCFLDTGSTVNVLNIGLEEEKTLEERLEAEEVIVQVPEMGAISFHCIPVAGLKQGEAILGLEFIKDRKIFIDFPGKKVFFEKTDANEISLKDK